MAPITLPDISLREYKMADRVERLRAIYFTAMPEICIERAHLVTKFSLANGFFSHTRLSILDKARLYRYVLENRKAIVHHLQGRCIKEKGSEPPELDFETIVKPVPVQLFAGSTTRKFKGVPLYPEFQALTLWPELESISKRACNPYYISKEEIEALNHEIFPHWIHDSILELTKERWYLGNLKTLGSDRPPTQSKQVKLMEQLVFFLPGKAECISHAIPDFCRAIYEGLREMILDAQGKRKKTRDPSEQDFYAAISEVLEGVITYSNNLAKEADKLVKEAANEKDKKELIEIAEIHRRVPEYPARNFREALTSIWVCWTALHLENPNVGLSLGRLDQILYPLYRKDMEDREKRGFDIDRAIELLCCLWLKIGDHVPMVPQAAEQLFGGGGSNQAITIGGIDKYGDDAVNDLTYVILRTIELMKLRDPNLNARYHPWKNKGEYLRRLCEANIITGATPAIHNDQAVISALRAKGDPEERARDYGIVGCVEPVSRGAYGSCASILLNLASVLELTLFNGRHRHTHKNTGMEAEPISIETGNPADFQNFVKFKRAFERQMKWIVNQATALNNFLGKTHQDFYPTPILSAFFEGPMEHGKDLSRGGACINSSGVAVIGLADVADSLSAINEVVFDPAPLPDERVCFGQLLHALKEDFKGYESLYRRLKNAGKTPKFGNEDSNADENVKWLLSLLDGAFGNKVSYRLGHYRVGYWTLTTHTGFGRLMGATPNGRKSGEAFASGLTPVSGVTPWLTKTCNSVAHVAHRKSQCISNGMAFNVKFTPEGDKMLDRLINSVSGYFSKGGMEIQFNIIPHMDLDRAMSHPEEYPDLLVRVSGYTAYFKDLGPEMQREIMNRTEFLASPDKPLPRDFPFPQKVHPELSLPVKPGAQAAGVSQSI